MKGPALTWRQSSADDEFLINDLDGDNRENANQNALQHRVADPHAGSRPRLAKAASDSGRVCVCVFSHNGLIKVHRCALCKAPAR